MGCGVGVEPGGSVPVGMSERPGEKTSLLQFPSSKGSVLHLTQLVWGGGAAGASAGLGQVPGTFRIFLVGLSLFFCAFCVGEDSFGDFHVLGPWMGPLNLTQKLFSSALSGCH